MLQHQRAQICPKTNERSKPKISMPQKLARNSKNINQSRLFVKLVTIQDMAIPNLFSEMNCDVAVKSGFCHKGAGSEASEAPPLLAF